MTLKRIRTLTAGIAAMALAAAAPGLWSTGGTTTADEPGQNLARSYIVQGYSIDDLLNVAHQRGWQVTHQLAIIDAISVQAPERDMQGATALDAISRVTPNHGVVSTGSRPSSRKRPAAKAAANDVLFRADFEVLPDGPAETTLSCEDAATTPENVTLRAEPFLRFIDQRVTLAIRNTSRPVDIESVDLCWPADNGELTALTVGDKAITLSADTGYGEADTTPGYLRLSVAGEPLSEGDKLRRGEQLIDLEFGQQPEADMYRYRVRLNLTDGTRLEFVPNEGSVIQGFNRDTFFPTIVRADDLHRGQVTGSGVAVAVIDTGMDGFWALELDTRDRERLVALYNAIDDREGNTFAKVVDNFGHGSHVTSVAVSSRATQDFDSGELTGSYNGIAPDAGLVVVKALDDDGHGTYADVIRGIDYVVRNKDQHGTRVLNLSLSAPVRSHYWEDPLNQAVMRAWQAGITVVASAGNTGPEAMTIGVPGNVPYVITVGSMTDSFSPSDITDDVLSDFSAAGPTHEGFVKPDVTAPGGHIMGVMFHHSVLADNYPQFSDGEDWFVMSGTSQAAAVVTGAVALMLQSDPGLTPDDVKCRLMSTARPAVDETGGLALSIFQQGAGLIDAWSAAYATDTGCGNRGLDIDADLDDLAHYGGLANRDEDGNYYIMGPDGDSYLWNDSYLWGESYLWADSFLWADSYLWADSFLWADSYLWGEAGLSADSFLWGDASIEVNTWVENQ